LVNIGVWQNLPVSDISEQFAWSDYESPALTVELQALYGVSQGAPPL